ncbi:hypothetical protein K7X08_010531 [Anisodus acutangulus]|uniref:Uncharacterized protein n=1 Tax=Anisodus acutangulus TaxID=402998 RepID=A0A9Q1N1X6_9SOLA|nr:hypothetical protein K7X08_010531 [Anisodus acutangulus]
MERPYDGTLLSLAQLWKSSIRLGTSSKVIIPMRLLEGGAPLMTREYVDWWSSYRTNPLKGSPDIVSKNSRQDHTLMSSKGGLNQLKEKPRSSSKAKLGLKELCGDELGDDIVADYIASLDDVDVIMKTPRSSTSPGNRKSFQLVVTNAAKVVANKITHPKTFEPSSWPLKHSAPSFDPQEIIFRFKSTFIYEMWGALCEWVTQFSMGYLGNVIELEASIALTLEEIRKANIIDISTLENLVETFFKAYTEYAALRLSRMTKESHQESLADAQRRLHDAKQEHEKLDGSLEKLQVNIAKVEKDSAALASKKEKIIALLDEYQEKLSKIQEKITITEGEIYTIKANHTLSDDEMERLSM